MNELSDDQLKELQLERQNTRIEGAAQEYNTAVEVICKKYNVRMDILVIISGNSLERVVQFIPL